MQKRIRLRIPTPTSIPESLVATACSHGLIPRQLTEGTIAEASQNFTGSPAARQGASPRPKRRPLDAVVEWQSARLVGASGLAVRRGTFSIRIFAVHLTPRQCVAYPTVKLMILLSEFSCRAYAKEQRSPIWAIILGDRPIEFKGRVMVEQCLG